MLRDQALAVLAIVVLAILFFVAYTVLLRRWDPFPEDDTFELRERFAEIVAGWESSASEPPGR